MTSLLRDDVSVPIVSAASTDMTDRPESASARATASPTTPAPTTIASVSIIRQSRASHRPRSPRTAMRRWRESAASLPSTFSTGRVLGRGCPRSPRRPQRRWLSTAAAPNLSALPQAGEAAQANDGGGPQIRRQRRRRADSIQLQRPAQFREVFRELGDRPLQSEAVLGRDLVVAREARADLVFG